MVGDIVAERGRLFLGSRLKRLGERMQGDVVRLAEQAGLAVQPGQYPLLATLDASGPLTVGELTEALGVSQPTVTRAAARLLALGLVEASRAGRDRRLKTLSLTQAGTAALTRSKAVVWPRVEAAVTELVEGLDGPLLDQLAAIEARLADRSLHERAVAGSAPVPAALTEGLAIREYRDDLAGAFRDINAEWIGAMYRLEDTDRDVLDHPRERIIDRGGTILFVEAAGLGIVGACALQKTGPTSFELTKMGVREAARGRKAGEFLLAAMIARGRALGADPLYLLSNKKSAAAIHLYEKLGFVHDGGIMREFGARYARCDVAMLYAPTAAA